MPLLAGGIVKYAIGGAVSLGSLYGGYQVFHPSSQFDIYNIGAARFGRAAFTVSHNYVIKCNFNSIKMQERCHQ